MILLLLIMTMKSTLKSLPLDDITRCAGQKTIYITSKGKEHGSEIRRRALVRDLQKTLKILSMARLQRPSTYITVSKRIVNNCLHFFFVATTQVQAQRCVDQLHSDLYQHC